MNIPVRVLHVFSKMDRGGAESRIMDLYRAIDRSKVQFDFVVKKKGGAFEREILDLGGRIYELSYKNMFFLKRYADKWEKFLIEHPEYNIIHGHITSIASVYMKQAKKMNIRKRIIHIRSAGDSSLIKKILIKIINYNLKKYITHMFAVSVKAGKYYFGVKDTKNKKVTVIHNAINCKEYVFNEKIRDRLRNEMHFGDCFVIGHVGRYHIAKNYPFILEIFSEIIKLNKNSILLLVGVGNGKLEIEKKINLLNLNGKVIVTEVKSNVCDYLQAMDVFLFPSLYEGLPGSVIEAQASGLKCFISDTITDEVCITDLAQVISLKKSAEEWAKIINSNKEYIRRDTFNEIKSAGFNIDSVAEQLTSFYLEES